MRGRNIAACVGLALSTGSCLAGSQIPKGENYQAKMHCISIEDPSDRANCAFAIDEIRVDVTDGVTKGSPDYEYEIQMHPTEEDITLAETIRTHLAEGGGITLDEDGIIIRSLDHELAKVRGSEQLSFFGKYVLPPGILALFGLGYAVITRHG